MAGSIAVACYKPKPGCDAALAELVREHLPILRSQNLVTDRESIMMRSKDGTIIEVFEWRSPQAIESAHSNPVVLAMWERFALACTYEVPASVPEFQQLFGGFEPFS
jgi:hypothetical protein